MIKVAVTAAGGGVGQSIIKSIAHAERLSAAGKKYSTVAIDPDPRAAGLYMADKGRIGPRLVDPNFIERLIEICKEEDCKYLFPGFDAELPILSDYKERFKAAEIDLIVSDPDVIELSNSKKSLELFMEEKIGSGFITSAKNTDDLLNKGFLPPFLVKPIVGCRSQGIIKLLHDDNLAACETLIGRERLSGFELIAHNFNLECPEPKYSASEFEFIQPFIDGAEYTCGTVSFGGNVLGIICMERELRNGDTYKAKVNQNPVVLEFVHNLISKIKPFGACNVQLRLRDNVPYVLEINARCSGTTAARTLAGFNEPRIVLDYLEEGKVLKLRIDDDLEIYRYWEEIVVRPDNKVSK